MSARRVVMASVGIVAISLWKLSAPLGKSRAPHPSQVASASPVNNEAMKLISTFESEIRSSNADTEEKKIEDVFDDRALPAGLLKSVLCHQSICRASLDWNRSRLMAVMSVTTRLMRDFGPQMALEPVGELGQDNVREMRLYLPRRDAIGLLARAQ